MENAEKIKACYKAAINYPDLAKRLSEIGVESYTVDTASSTILYRFKEGETVIHEGNIVTRIISENFNEQKRLRQSGITNKAKQIIQRL